MMNILKRLLGRDQFDHIMKMIHFVYEIREAKLNYY